MKKLAILILLSFSVNAENSLVIGGVSYHIGEREYYYAGETRRYNEVNPSLGWCHDNDCIVVSKLSYYNWGASAYSEIHLDMLTTKYFSGGIRIGGVVGYKYTPVNMIIAPLVQPVITFNIYESFRAQVGLIASDPPVLTFNLKYKPSK